MLQYHISKSTTAINVCFTAKRHLELIKKFDFPMSEDPLVVAAYYEYSSHLYLLVHRYIKDQDLFVCTITDTQGEIAQLNLSFTAGYYIFNPLSVFGEDGLLMSIDQFELINRSQALKDIKESAEFLTKNM